MRSHISKRNRQIRFNLIVIFEIILPFLFLKVTPLLNSLPMISKINYPSFFIFTSLWIFISYIKGRYSYLNKLNSLNNIISVTKELFFTSSVLTILLLFLKVIGMNNIFDSKNMPILIIIFNCLSVIKDIILLKIYDNKFVEIFFLGEDKELKIFKKILKEYNFNKKIKFNTASSNLNSKTLPDQVIISKTYPFKIDENKLLRILLLKGIKIYSLPKWCESELNCLPVLLIQEENLIDSKLFSNNKDIEFRIKRFGDIVLGIILLFLSLPILIISCLFIWINDRGPIFYSQTREGLFGEKIKIIKLRTMKTNAEENGPQWATNNDKRITFVGKILRKTRIDELPQIITVINGQMSLIGPRPERPEFNSELNDLIPNYYLRNYIKPGLSGWAQVNYPYGASLEDAKKKLSYDIYYIRNFSFWIDLLILFKTARVVFSGIGWSPK